MVRARVLHLARCALDISVRSCREAENAKRKSIAVSASCPKIARENLATPRCFFRTLAECEPLIAGDLRSPRCDADLLSC